MHVSAIFREITLDGHARSYGGYDNHLRKRHKPSESISAPKRVFEGILWPKRWSPE